jgi:hypothetical protein
MSQHLSAPDLWKGQGLHLACLVALLALVSVAWNYLGRPYPFLFWLAVAVPIAHQLFVWIAWRLKLGSAPASEQIGMRGYITAFFILFGGRFISLFVLAWADRGTLNLSVAPRALLTIFLLVVGFYAMYSVKRYFGLVRAAGADHFDPAYRELPLVSQGIFRFTSNGMYLYAFFLFWAIPIGLNSSAALIVAAFSHAYIWVHYFATEKPDMDYLYGVRKGDDSS